MEQGRRAQRQTAPLGGKASVQGGWPGLLMVGSEASRGACLSFGGKDSGNS